MIGLPFPEPIRVSVVSSFMSRIHRRVLRALPWLIAAISVMVGTWLVDVDLWRSALLRYAACFAPAVVLGGGNAWLWLRPMRGDARWMWVPWLLGAVLASAGWLMVPWAGSPVETLRFWPMSLPVLAALATYSGALRRGREGAGERPLREVALHATLASATLILIARFGDANAAVTSVSGDPWFADTAVRSVVRSAGTRITSHGLVGILAPGVWLVHARRPRASVVLLPMLGVGALALGLLVLDLLELHAALALEEVVAADFRGVATPRGPLDGLSSVAVVADLIGVSALATALFTWGLAVSVAARSSLSAARLGWADAGPLLAVIALSTTSSLAPPTDGPTNAPSSVWSLGADASFETLVRARFDPREPRALDLSGVFRGIGILTADGELRTTREGLTRYHVPVSDFSCPGRPWDRAAVEILVDRRVTLAQLLAAAGSLGAFDELFVGYRVRPELDSARYARRRWSFLERASRAAAGWSIDLVADVGACGPSIEIEGARYTRCARDDGEGDTLVLRDPGRLTVAEWLDTASTEDDWIAIEVSRGTVGRPPSPESVWPHDPPSATHQLSEVWPLSVIGLLLALVVSASLVRRGPVASWVRWVGAALNLALPGVGRDEGPYRNSEKGGSAASRASAGPGRRAVALALGSYLVWLLAALALGSAVLRWACGP